MSEEIENKKSFFTPCRTVGLRRKSVGTPSSIQNSSVSSPTFVTETKSTPKRLLVDAGRTNFFPKKIKKSTNIDEDSVLVPNTSSPTDKSENLKCEEVNSSELDEQIMATKSRISKIQDQIKNLESIALNAKQHDLGELNKLIQKWRKGCQQALNDLLTEYKNRDNTCSMLILLNQLGIPLSLIHYSEVETDFYE